jgi:hypothetical protein
MKYFFDTEFVESGPDYPIHLLSIGIVSGDGREYYAVVEPNNDRLRLATDWVWENVIKGLNFGEAKPRSVIAKEIKDFVGIDPEWWGYFADYDFVLLCQLYGSMLSVPQTWPQFCLDVKQLAYMMGNPRLPAMPGIEEHKHNALWDARETMYRYNWLVGTRNR